MGNCGNLCNKNFKYKGDIIIDKLLIEQNEYHCIYSYNLSQIIYLQKEIKHFLKRKKIHKSNHSSNKSTKQTGNKRKTNQDKNTENNLMVQKHFHYNSRCKKVHLKVKILRIVVYAKIRQLLNQIKMEVHQKINPLRI